MEKFLFFRNAVGDSALVPARKITSYQTDTDSDAIYFFLEAPTVGEKDTITVSVDLDQVHEVFDSLADVLNNPSSTFIVIADDVDNEYVDENINGVGQINLS